MPTDCTGRPEINLSLLDDEQSASFEADPMNRNKKGLAAPQAAKGANQRMKPKQVKQASVAAAYATGQSSGKAQVYRQSSDSCRIVHRELVSSLTGSINFTVQNSYSINPGIAATFPWLALQAQGWERYHFNKLKLCYYTRTGSNTPGSVIMSPDYDAADSAPVNEQIASTYFGTEEDAPWKDITLGFDNRLLSGERFVRTGQLAANLDIKTYDVANAYVSTIDGTAVAWGKLWFEYDVTLLNPQSPASGAQGSGTLTSGGGSIASATPFGAVPVSTGPYALSATATNVLTFSGLNIGAEYALFAGSKGTVITSYGFATLIGGTQVTGGLAGFPAAATSGDAFITFTATASSGSVIVSSASSTITFSCAVLSALSPAPSF
jgi:hypothetical protein